MLTHNMGFRHWRDFAERKMSYCMTSKYKVSQSSQQVKPETKRHREPGCMLCSLPSRSVASSFLWLSLKNGFFNALHTRQKRESLPELLCHLQQPHLNLTSSLMPSTSKLLADILLRYPVLVQSGLARAEIYPARRGLSF